MVLFLNVLVWTLASAAPLSGLMVNPLGSVDSSIESVRRFHDDVAGRYYHGNNDPASSRHPPPTGTNTKNHNQAAGLRTTVSDNRGNKNTGDIGRKHGKRWKNVTTPKYLKTQLPGEAVVPETTASLTSTPSMDDPLPRDGMNLATEGEEIAKQESKRNELAEKSTSLRTTMSYFQTTHSLDVPPSITHKATTKRQQVAFGPEVATIRNEIIYQKNATPAKHDTNHRHSQRPGITPWIVILSAACFLIGVLITSLVAHQLYKRHIRNLPGNLDTSEHRASQGEQVGSEEASADVGLLPLPLRAMDVGLLPTVDRETLRPVGANEDDQLAVPSGGRLWSNESFTGQRLSLLQYDYLDRLDGDYGGDEPTQRMEDTPPTILSDTTSNSWSTSLSSWPARVNPASHDIIPTPTATPTRPNILDQTQHRDSWNQTSVNLTHTGDRHSSSTVNPLGGNQIQWPADIDPSWSASNVNTSGNLWQIGDSTSPNADTTRDMGVRTLPGYVNFPDMAVTNSSFTIDRPGMTPDSHSTHTNSTESSNHGWRSTTAPPLSNQASRSPSSDEVFLFPDEKDLIIHRDTLQEKSSQSKRRRSSSENGFYLKIEGSKYLIVDKKHFPLPESTPKRKISPGTKERGKPGSKRHSVGKPASDKKAKSSKGKQCQERLLRNLRRSLRISSSAEEEKRPCTAATEPLSELHYSQILGETSDRRIENKTNKEPHFECSDRNTFPSSLKHDREVVECSKPDHRFGQGHTWNRQPLGQAANWCPELREGVKHSGMSNTPSEEASISTPEHPHTWVGISTECQPKPSTHLPQGLNNDEFHLELNKIPQNGSHLIFNPKIKDQHTWAGDLSREGHLIGHTPAHRQQQTWPGLPGQSSESRSRDIEQSHRFHRDQGCHRNDSEQRGHAGHRVHRGHEGHGGHVCDKSREGHQGQGQAEERLGGGESLELAHRVSEPKRNPDVTNERSDLKLNPQLEHTFDDVT